MSQESPADDKSGEEWKRCIESGDAGINFGLFTMGVMHWKARSGSLVSRVFVILNVWLVLCAQILLPVVFATYHWKNYNEGICPSSGTANTRVTMFAVAALYTAKLTMRMIKQVKDRDFGKLCFPADFNGRWFFEHIAFAWTRLGPLPGKAPYT